MERIARFETVSLPRFITDWTSAMGGTEEAARRAYERIHLPRRATAGSAGYDLFVPADLTLAPGETIKLPTGLRVRMAPGWVLLLLPRSGLGFQYRLQMDNTVGVIDSDYYGAENEGHIFIKLTNATNEGKTLRVHVGEGIAQGIFTPFGLTEDDDAQTARTGGFGSTTRRIL